MLHENIAARMKRGFFLSIQVDPPSSGEEERFDEFLHELKFRAAGDRIDVEGVDINDSKKVPSASSAIVAAHLLRQAYRLPHIMPHIAIRDTGVTRTVNTVFGLYQAGLRSLLVIRGDRYTGKQSTGFEGECPIMSHQVIGALHAKLRVTGVCPDLMIAAAFDQNNNFFDESREMKEKIAAGADFFMSQLIFNEDQLEALAQNFPDDRSLIVGLFPLPYQKIFASAKDGKVPEVVMPQEIAAEGAKCAQDDAALEAWTVERTARLLLAAKAKWSPQGGVQGAYIATPRGKPHVIFSILSRARELSR